ncbi:MAG: SGNH/GDSL hydrolase family protein [Solirubrobacterales bacterium]
MKLVIFGGSTAAGFGVKDSSFAAQIAGRLELEFTNLAGSSALVSDSLAWIDEARGAELVIVMHGSGEALVRPTERSLRWMPPRWRRRGWMDPRPYFSSNARRRLPQRAESAIRWRAKVALIKLTGGECIMPLDEYERLTREFARGLKTAGAQTVVFVGSSGMDARYFPKSADDIERYDAVTRAIAHDEGALFIDILDTCARWDDYFGDHLHPTVSGHTGLADRILDELEAAGRLPAGRPANAA